LANKQQHLFKIFKKAVESERAAQKMYMDAISLCGDGKTIRTLQKLLRDEHKHEERVIELYNRLRTGNHETGA
jgi:rubrerythrin